MDNQEKIDRLYDLLFDIEALEAESEKLKSELKTEAQVIFESTGELEDHILVGKRAFAKITQSLRGTTDWKTLTKDHGISKEIIEEYTTKKRVFSIKVDKLQVI